MKQASYEALRRRYQPDRISVLFIAESPPPAPNVQSSRQFYYSERIRREDRLFINTIRAIYPSAVDLSEAELEAQKEAWLKRFKADGFYMIEALEASQPHEVTKIQRQELIRQNLPRLIKRVRRLNKADTKIILIKSNVFIVAAEPLKKAGFKVLNDQLLDYPGRYNQSAYRQKLSKLLNLSS